MEIVDKEELDIRRREGKLPLVSALVKTIDTLTAHLQHTLNMVSMRHRFGTEADGPLCEHCDAALRDLRIVKGE